MKVAPVSEIPQFVPAGVPQIYISRDVSFLTVDYCAQRLTFYQTANPSYQLRHQSFGKLGRGRERFVSACGMGIEA